MKRLLLATFISLGVISTSSAQYGMDFGLSVGAANYLGEIGGTSGEAKPFLFDLKLQQANFAIGGFYRYSITRTLAAKLSFNYARIGGADSLSEEPTRIGRNLSFRTDILEFNLTGEYTFFSFNDMSRRSRARIDFNAFGFAGFGALLYYPYAEYDGKWYYLRPLATEGIENTYSEMTFAVPLGVGMNFTFERKFRIGLEMGYRFSFTDYLDDVSTDYAYNSELPFLESTIFSNRSPEAYARGDADLPDIGFYDPGSIRGNPDGNDGYVIAQLTFSYVINTSNSFSRSRYKSVVNRRKKRTKF